MAKFSLPLMLLLSNWCACLGASPLFDPNPEHPWNRLREFFFVRKADDGLAYTREELEPPFQALSRYLVEGPTHERAIALLDNFLNQGSDQLIRDPLKRAVLQRDLWGVFGTTAGTGNLHWWEIDNQMVKAGIEDTGDEEFGRKPSRRELQKRLVAIMRRVALSAEEIASLPDNLQDAVKSGSLPAAYDSAHPDHAFLPRDLWQPDGPWLLVGNSLRSDGLGAPTHVQFTNGRSLFLVLLRLSQGQGAAKAYLAKLSGTNSDEFPEGTQLALIRRMLLIDKSGNVRVSPVTEEVQLRVFRETPSERGEFFDSAELLLSRRDLFAGRGGLRVVAADETSCYDISAFHGGSPNGTADLLETKPRGRAPIVMDCCITCHRFHGGHRMAASAFASDQRAIDLQPTTLDKQEQSGLKWLKKTYSWGLLQGMWETQP
jgi:hypothetical protein